MSNDLRLSVWVAWNKGRVRYFDGTRLRDMGGFSCKGMVQSWCHEHRVRFFEEVPAHLVEGVTLQRLGRRRRVRWQERPQRSVWLRV